MQILFYINNLENYRMFVGTWNVGGKAPHEGLNLRDWLHSSSPQPADLYVIGYVFVLYTYSCFVPIVPLQSFQPVAFS